MYAQTPTFAPIRRKSPVQSYRDLERACTKQDRRDAERERQQARKQERSGKRGQAFV